MSEVASGGDYPLEIAGALIELFPSRCVGERACAAVEMMVVEIADDVLAGDLEGAEALEIAKSRAEDVAQNCPFGQESRLGGSALAGCNYGVMCQFPRQNISGLIAKTVESI